MAPAANIHTVARQARVSVGTVSNVLNHPELVAEATRHRVERAIEELSFVRNGTARQLREGRSRTIGLIVHDVANPFFTDVARGVEDAANDVGCAVILCNSDGSEEKENRYLRVLEEQRVAGILITPVGPNPRQLEGVRARSGSVVLLDRQSPTPDQCSVAVDDVRGGDLGVAHLLALGHKRIGLVNGPTRVRQCADRRTGALRALRSASLDPKSALFEITIPRLDFRGGEQAVETLLAASDRPTGVFCNNDLMAIGVLRGLSKAGVRVPDDIALVGYDDIEFAALSSVPLTSIRQPRYELGYTAAQLLLSEAEDGPAHEHQQIMFQPELVIRESSGAWGRAGMSGSASGSGR